MTSKQVRRIYAELPTIDCKGECWPFCSPIRSITSDVEWQQMIEHHGGEPEPSHPDLCAFLKNGRCTVYKARPAICRFWGIVQTMQCPWGCKPSPRYLTVWEMHQYLYRIRTGASPAEARNAITFFTRGISAYNNYSASVEATVRSWTPTVRKALMELQQQGRTEALGPFAMEALDFLNKEQD